MSDTCERCGRRTVVSNYPDADECSRMDGAAIVGDPWCDAIASAYERGRRDGIAYAKATAKVADIADRSPMSGDVIDWSETDKDERGRDD